MHKKGLKRAKTKACFSHKNSACKFFQKRYWLYNYICGNIVTGGGYVKEKAINFKVDEELYTKVKVKVAIEGMTIKDYVINLIKKDLEKDKKNE